MTTATRAVLDANVYVSAALLRSEGAREWTERLGSSVRAHAPDLLWPEVTNALRGLVLSGAIPVAAAHRAIDLTKHLPVELHSSRALAGHALDAALDRRLSAYDATYLVLADALDAVLVTADRRLAQAATKAELIR